MAYTTAQKEATARYNKKHYDRIDLVIPKGRRAEIKKIALSCGKSANRFIIDAIDKAIAEMEQEKNGPSS